jgi:hypothetical protein
MTTAGVTVSTTAPSPSWLARNAKFIWASLGVVLAVLVDIVDWQLQVIPAAWLPAVHLIILGLTAAGVQRDTNLQGVSEVLALVGKVLPNHQLVPAAAAETAPAAPPTLALAAAANGAKAGNADLATVTSDLSAAMDAALAGTPAAVSAVTNLPIPPVSTAPPAA